MDVVVVMALTGGVSAAGVGSETGGGASVVTVVSGGVESLVGAVAGGASVVDVVVVDTGGACDGIAVRPVSEPCPKSAVEPPPSKLAVVSGVEFASLKAADVVVSAARATPSTPDSGRTSMPIDPVPRMETSPTIATMMPMSVSAHMERRRKPSEPVVAVAETLPQITFSRPTGGGTAASAAKIDIGATSALRRSEHLLHALA